MSDAHDMPLEPGQIPVQPGTATAAAPVHATPQAAAAAAAAAMHAAPAGQPVMQQPAFAQPAFAQPVAHPAPSAEHAAMAQHAPMEQPAQTMPAASVEDDLADVRPVPRVSIKAFCQTEHVANVIHSASLDRRMAKAHVNAQMGGIALAVEYYQTSSTPNLIVLESRDDTSSLIHELESLAEVCDEGTNVVVIGHRNDVQLYRQLISRGVSEYLVAPITMGDFMRVVSELFVAEDAEPLGQTMAFVGAKGGVGSSTVAHNVAWAISSSFESDVILTDLDLAFGTANIDFDKDPAQGVAEAVFSADRVDETFLDRLLAKCSDHLSLLAAPSTLDREYDFGEADFAELIETAQRGSPNVVIDLPHLWTGWAKETLTTADRVVITATPDLASLRNTKNMIDKLAELRPNDSRPFLVLNQVGVPKRPEIAAADFASSLEMEPSAIIPFEPALFGLAANNGQMISETDPKSETAQVLHTLAQIVTGRRTIQPVKKSAFDFLSKLKKKSA